MKLPPPLCFLPASLGSLYMTNQSTGSPVSSTHCKAHEPGNNAVKQKSKNVEKPFFIFLKKFSSSTCNKLTVVRVFVYGAVQWAIFLFIFPFYTLKTYKFFSDVPISTLDDSLLRERGGGRSGNAGMFVRLSRVLRVFNVVGVTSSCTLRV